MSELEEQLTKLIEGLRQAEETIKDLQDPGILGDQLNACLRIAKDVAAAAELNEGRVMIPYRVLQHVDKGKNPSEYNTEILQACEVKCRAAEQRVEKLSKLRDALDAALKAEYPAEYAAFREIDPKKESVKVEPSANVDVDMEGLPVPNVDVVEEQTGVKTENESVGMSSSCAVLRGESSVTVVARKKSIISVRIGKRDNLPLDSEAPAAKRNSLVTVTTKEIIIPPAAPHDGFMSESSVSMSQNSAAEFGKRNFVLKPPSRPTSPPVSEADPKDLDIQFKLSSQRINVDP